MRSRVEILTELAATDCAGCGQADLESLGAAVVDQSYELRPTGWVESALTDLEAALHQSDEGSPDAWLVFDDIVSAGLTPQY